MTHVWRNKLVNGKQMTATWHVDDIKISHVKSSKFTNLIGEVRMILEGRLEQLMKMVIPEIYSQHIHMDRKNKKLLCVNLEKALYGCLKSALLF